MSPISAGSEEGIASRGKRGHLGEWANRARLLKKATHMLVSHGFAFTFRAAVWKIRYEYFLRQRKALAAEGPKPALIRFLGKEFELHHSNEGISEELRLFGVHEPSATTAYLGQLCPGDHVIDVGSNLGYYLLLAAQRVGSTGRLLGFEPAPTVYDILERNVNRSGHRNIWISPYAIGARSGDLQFYESKVPNWGSIFQDSRLQQTKAITVEARTLDSIVRDTPGFRPRMLRMDVEGAELLVLEGAREILQEYHPRLFIEFHNFALGWNAVREALFDLRRLGYSTGILIERTWDQPWLSKRMRDLRCWRGDLGTLINRVECPRDPLVRSTLTVLMTAPHQ